MKSFMNNLSSKYGLAAVFTFLLLQGATNSAASISLPADLHRIFSVDWSPDGSMIAVGGGQAVCGNDLGNYGIRMVDTATQQILQILSGHRCHVETVSWSPDGARLASGSSDGTARIWDVASGQTIATSDPPIGFDSRLGEVWSPDGLRIADFYGSRNNLYIWDASTGQTLQTYQNDDPIAAVSWSPDGSSLAVGTWNGVQIVDALTASRRATFTAFAGDINSVDWSPDGTRLATGSVDYLVRVWDVATGLISMTLEGHTEVAEHILVVAWSPDGSELVSAGADGIVNVWNASTGKSLQVFQVGFPVYAVSWSPDGTQLAYGGVGGTLEIVTVSSLETPQPNESAELREE